MPPTCWRVPYFTSSPDLTLHLTHPNYPEWNSYLPPKPDPPTVFPMSAALSHFQCSVRKLGIRFTLLLLSHSIFYPWGNPWSSSFLKYPEPKLFSSPPLSPQYTEPPPWLTGCLQWPPKCFLCFHPFSWKAELNTADFVISFKYKSDHITPLLKTPLWILFFFHWKKKPSLHNGLQGPTWFGTHCLSNLSSFHSRHMGLFAVSRTCQACFHLRSNSLCPKFLSPRYPYVSSCVTL